MAALERAADAGADVEGRQPTWLRSARCALESSGAGAATERRSRATPELRARGTHDAARSTTASALSMCRFDARRRHTGVSASSGSRPMIRRPEEADRPVAAPYASTTAARAKFSATSMSNHPTSLRRTCTGWYAALGRKLLRFAPATSRAGPCMAVRRPCGAPAG